MMLEIYKPGQGKYTRLWSAGGVSVVAAIACYRLYKSLYAWDVPLPVSLLSSVALCAALIGVVFWLVNKPSIADFMIAAEGEMKKVSWSSRAEIMASTWIVIAVLIIMSLILGVADVAFMEVFSGLWNV